MTIKTMTCRPPRLGLIKMGYKAQAGHPVNSEFFVMPKPGELGHEVLAARFDEETDDIPVFFLFDEVDRNLDDAFRLYKGERLQCKGDGIIGKWLIVVDDQDSKGKTIKVKSYRDQDCAKRGCPWYGEGCGPTGLLSFGIHDIPGIGVFQLNTKSHTAVKAFRDCLEMCLHQYGRIRGIPFSLYRHPITVTTPAGMKMTTMGVGLRLHPSFTGAQDTAARQLASNLVDRTTGEIPGAPSNEYLDEDDIPPF